MTTTPDQRAFGRRFWQTIQGKLFLLLTFLFIPTLLIQAHVYQDRLKAYRAERLQDNLEIARAMANRFEEFVRDVLRQELTIGLTFTLPQTLTVEQMNNVLGKTRRENAGVRNLVWANTEGRSIASDLPDAIGLDITKRSYYRQILAGSDSVVSDLYVSQVDDRPCFSISRGIRDEVGNLLGIMIAIILPENLDQALAVEREKGGGVALVDSRGMLVYRYPRINATWEERDWLKQYPVYDEVLKGKEIATTVYATFEGKNRLVGFTPISSIGWAATAGRTEEVAMATIRASLLPQTVLLLLLTTVVFGIALVLSRNLSTSVAQLRRQVIALMRGETGTPVITSGPTELKDLADSFNSMAEELRSREMSLRVQREWLQVTLTSIGDAVLATDTEGRITFLNPTSESLTGWPLAEAMGQSARNVFRTINEETQEPVEDIVERVLRTGGTVALANHTALVTRDGHEIPIEDSAAPIKDSAGNISGVVVVFHDVTERRRQEEELLNLNRTLRARSSANQAMIHAENEPDLLNDICRIVVEDCGHPMVWIGFAEHDEEKTVRPVAQAGFEEGYLESIKITWADTERGRGPTGEALRTGTPNICHDMLTDPRMEPWREQALKRGYASSIALPLKAEGEILGALTIYAREPGRFAAGEVKLLTELADDLAYGITTIRMQLARREAEGALLEREARLRLLSTTAARLLAAEDPLGIVTELARGVMVHLNCHAFFNFVADDQAGKLHLNAYAGITDEEARKIEWLDYGVAVCGCAARDGSHIVAENIRSVPDPRTDLVKSYGIQAYACHPLMAGGKVIGTLSFGTKTQTRFSLQDLDLMKTVADQVAVAMERVRLMRELEQSRDELEMRVKSRTAELVEANIELRETEGALRRSENRLRNNNELLQKIVDGITDPLIMLDKEGWVTMINKAAMDYYGATNDMDFFRKPCFQGLRGRESVCPGCDYPFPSVGNQPVTFEREGLYDSRRVESITIYPVLNDSGQREAFIIKKTDVTQAKLLERQILHNEKLAALGLMTSGIAHEINNPNTFIYFNIPILRQYLEELMPILDEYAALHPDLEVLHMSYGELKEDIFKLLGNMEHGSQRINKIVGTLKSFVRKRDAEGLQKVDLKQLIDKVVALCHAEIRRRVRSFEVLLPGDLPPVHSDPEALEQVLLNLLINAVHACDKEDSRVRLRVEQGGAGRDGFTIEVSDNGSGIEEAVRDRIFDPFFTTKSSSLGTGLGLYICHHHVESLGGSIEVESSVGQGATFRVLLPQTDKK